MRLVFTATILVATGWALATPPSKCAKDVAICTVPLNFDEPDTAPLSVTVEPAPTTAPTPQPSPVATQAVEPAKAQPATALPIPTPVPLAVGIVDILDWQLRDYWLLSGDEKPMQQLRSRGRCERATMTARFIVDNNGYTDEVRVLRNTSLNPFYERRIEERVRSRFYTPSFANPQRQSVRVEETFRISC